MACAAGAGASTRAFHLEVDGLSDVKKIVARSDGYGCRVRGLVYDGDGEPENVSQILILESCGSDSSPGLGGVRCPCRTTEEAENFLRALKKVEQRGGGMEKGLEVSRLALAKVPP